MHCRSTFVLVAVTGLALPACSTTGTESSETTGSIDTGDAGEASESESAGTSETGITATAGDGDGDGDGDGTVVLRNDGFEEGMPVGFQGGFVQGECFASTFVPDAADLPLDLWAIQTLVGGDSATVTMSVTLFAVDSSGMPMMEITNPAPFSIIGADNAFNEVSGMDLMAPTITGEFAVSFCHDAHDGAPSIARDDDGDIQPGRNWIYTGGAWVDAATLGVSGDWILRVVAVPA